ncbi:MAG: 30S ribosomal protein S20 [Candidatus Taylorbacteria bacterium]|nr:30S ribosomal protein S20 [Candidatus Taylorbacteria bacterium]
MPITSSAKKALRVAKKKKIFNTRRKSTMDSSIKAIKKLIKENKIKEAEKMLPEVYQAIDKAMKTKLIKKNNAARNKSRITVFLNKKRS